MTRHRNIPAKTGNAASTGLAAPDFQMSGVAVVFDAYPPDVKDKLLGLRRLIFDTASTTEGVGALQETLKWGQPSYLTAQSKSGTTIRIDQIGSLPGRYALYVHCQTNLVSTFRELYPDELTYDGARAIVFDQDKDIPEEVLRHCIALALTYHLRKAHNRR